MNEAKYSAGCRDLIYHSSDSNNDIPIYNKYNEFRKEGNSTVACGKIGNNILYK